MPSLKSQIIKTLTPGTIVTDWRMGFFCSLPLAAIEQRCTSAGALKTAKELARLMGQRFVFDKKKAMAEITHVTIGGDLERSFGLSGVGAEEKLAAAALMKAVVAKARARNRRPPYPGGNASQLVCTQNSAYLKITP